MANEEAKAAAGHYSNPWIQAKPIEELESLQILTATTKSII